MAAPDYKEMYFALFRASEDAVQLLQQAQRRAEEAAIADAPPPLRICTPESAPTGSDPCVDNSDTDAPNVQPGTAAPHKG